MLTAYGVSDIGPARKTNEDSFAADRQLQLLIVADGMGGHQAGEVASSLAVETIAAFVRRSEEVGECSWPYGIDPELSFCSNRLRTAIHLANHRIFRTAEEHDEYAGMGTTVVCGLISGNRLSVGHAGDSRLYVFAEGALTQVTADDTWEATVLADESSSSLPPHVHSMRHVLTNVLGARESAEVHLHEQELSGGETLLLCSDGLHNVVEDHELCALLSSEDPLVEIGARLIDAALRRGSRDNVTIVLARFTGD
ncbi:MAG: SpoIIE family protein phosphatase [Luteitalea sp.]|nr:SpoIIE family protein phosphatase [Luteitalea sp.]